MKKRLLSAAMALVMCLSLLPVAAFASESKWIESLDVVFDLPQAGQHPTMDLDPGKEGYTVLLKAWEDVTDSRHPRTMTAEDVFQEGGVYQITYKIQIHSGYYTDGDSEFRFPAGAQPEEVNPGEWCRHYLSRFSVSTHQGDVLVNEANFPDDGFRSYLLEKVRAAKDGVLTPAELRRVERLRPPKGTVEDLTGIEYFHNLRYLEMNGQKLQKADLRGNPILRTVHLEDNRLTTLDLRANPWVEEVCCAGNRLTSLRVDSCALLKTLDTDNNQLTSLSLDENYRLRRLYCANNQLKQLRLRHLPDLETLRCSDNRLKSLELGYLPALQDVRCSNAQLQELDVSRNRDLTRLIMNTEPAKKEIRLTAGQLGVTFAMVGAKSEKDIQDLTGGRIDASSGDVREDGIHFIYQGSDVIRFRVGETRYVLRRADDLPKEEIASLAYKDEWHWSTLYHGSYNFYPDEAGVITHVFPTRFSEEQNNNSLPAGYDLWCDWGERGFCGHYDFGARMELSGGSRYVAVMCYEDQLPPPQLTVTVPEDTGKPYLEWSRVDGAQEYQVEYASEDTTYDSLYTSRGNHLRHGSSRPGGTYSYRVRAVDSEGYPGRWSEDTSVSCPCNAPYVLMGSRSDGKPVLTWGIVKGAEKYQVLYACGDGEMEVLKTVSGTKLNHVSAEYGKTYTYQVRALSHDAAANSQLSEKVRMKVRRPDRPLDAPELTITNKRATGKPFLEWDAVKGAEKYEVYRAASKYGKFTRLWSGSGTHLTNSSAKPAGTYYYQIRAVDEDGIRGPFSPVKLRTCDLAQPNVKVTIRSDGKPVLRWQQVEGTLFYEVEYRTDGGKFEKLALPDGTKLTHGSAKRGHTYTYRVRAFAGKEAANSSWSYYDTVKVR